MGSAQPLKSSDPLCLQIESAGSVAAVHWIVLWLVDSQHNFFLSLSHSLHWTVGGINKRTLSASAHLKWVFGGINKRTLSASAHLKWVSGARFSAVQRIFQEGRE